LPNLLWLHRRFDEEAARIAKAVEQTAVATPGKEKANVIARLTSTIR